MAVTEYEAEKIKACLHTFRPALLDDMLLHGIIGHFNQGEFVVRQAHPIKYLPIVIEGSVKVYSDEEGYQFFLYTYSPTGTCIFSFANLFLETRSVAETTSTLLLITHFKAAEWKSKHPSFNEMILREYQKHITTSSKQPAKWSASI